MVVIRQNFDTGLPAYSDTLGTREKCHCNQVSIYPMIFSIRRSFLGSHNGHSKRGVTVSGVTVSGEPCNDLVEFSLGGDSDVESGPGHCRLSPAPHL